jgi:hypothetical protein
MKAPKTRQRIIGKTRLVHNTYYVQKAEGTVWGVAINRYRHIWTTDFFLGHVIQSFSIRKEQQ